ncbi:hypothetical protein ACLKA7_014257 [Drosophila subpalustris]
MVNENGKVDKDKETTDQHSKWSQFVEMNKYFHGVPLTRCQSAPCLQQMGNKMPGASVVGPTQLSLSWQLACNPADSSHLLLRSHSKSDRLRAKNLKYKHGPKMKLTPFREKAKSKVTQVTQDKPKIMVVDATKKMQIRQQQQDRENQRNHKVEKLEMPFNKPDQVPVAARVRKPRAELVAKGPKRTLGVPLCHRPTMLLGPRYYHDLQNYNQQLYYNQLQEQQRQQQLMQQRIYYRPMQHMSKPPPQGYDYEQGPRYEVPVQSMYHKLKKGSRYCGNFYYR